MQLFVALLFFVVLASACDQAAQQPIAFSKRAYLGETISFAIDTDFPNISGKTYTLSSENVRIQLWDQVTDAQHVLTPRTVIVGSSVLGTLSGEYDGSSEVSIAVFDLPTTLPAGFTTPPSSVWVIPVPPTGTLPINPNVYPTLEILGPASQGHGSTTFGPSTSPPDWLLPIDKKLEPLPSLRLRVKQATQFPPAWTIGSIQFDLVYPQTLVSNPRAYAKTTAARALAHAKDLSPGRARVMLVDPIALRLRDSVGAGPFVDVVFNQAGPFSVSDFDIENLLVTDINGNPLIDRREAIPDNSESYFTLYTRANQ